MSDEPPLLRLLEAILFASPHPLDRRAIAARMPGGADVAGLLEQLRRHYASRGVILVNHGGLWAFRTAPDLAGLLKIETSVERKLSRAAVETLAIIAYHQPLTRAEIEEIRGVALSKGTLDILFEAGWIRPKGRRRTPGRPMTWGTSEAFLDHFTLASLDDLPGIEDLKAAGLLDARPALASYGTGTPDADEDAEDGQE
ncbi:MAG: SMC-Scp complex subunit ScpB [Alphaproteobacteria bacterium]